MRQTTIDRFVEQARSVGAATRRVESLERALDRVVALSDGCGAVAAVGWGTDTLQALSERLNSSDRCGPPPLLLDADLRAHADTLAVGFTPAIWGVAETGTVLLDSADPDLRLATMLPNLHVVVLPANRVVPRMTDLSRQIHAALQPAGYLAMITGPSRTADVERVLTIGVHGPRELHILLLDDDPP